MKRTLSILLTIAMIISLIPAVFAADVPTMSTTVDKTEVQPGDTITLTLSIDKTITNLNNWEWAIYFDKTAYVKTSGDLNLDVCRARALLAQWEIMLISLVKMPSGYPA